MAVHVLVEQVAEAPRPSCIAGLRAEGAQPHEITGFDLHPVLVEPVYGLAFQHIEPMLHDVGFGKGDDSTGLEGHDIDVHVVTQVGGIDKAGGRPLAISARHGDGGDFILIGDEGRRVLQARNRFKGLAQPMEAHRLGVLIACRPVRTRRQIGITTGAKVMACSVQGQDQHAFDDKDHTLRSSVRFRLEAAAARRHFHDVLRKRLGKARQRPGDDPQPGAFPEGQIAGDDIAHDALGDHRIGLGEHGTSGQEIGLGRMAAMGRIVCAGFHGRGYPDLRSE